MYLFDSCYENVLCICIFSSCSCTYGIYDLIHVQLLYIVMEVSTLVTLAFPCISDRYIVIIITTFHVITATDKQQLIQCDYVSIYILHSNQHMYV